MPWCFMPNFSTHFLLFIVYVSMQFVLFGEIVLAHKVMYDKFGDDFLVQFVSRGFSAAHCSPDLAEQYRQKLQVIKLLWSWDNVMDFYGLAEANFLYAFCSYGGLRDTKVWESKIWIWMSKCFVWAFVDYKSVIYSNQNIIESLQ